MTVVLDTNALPVDQRADALRDTFSVEAPQQVDFARATGHRYRVEVVDVGLDVRLRHCAGVPLHVRRTARHVRMEAPEYVAFGLQRHGAALLTTDGSTRPASHLHLDCVDTTRPYALEQLDAGRRDDLVLANRELGVSVEVVRAAVPRIRASPLYPLFRAHVAGLFDATAGLDVAARLLVGQATTALARAVLLTAAEHGQARGALADTLELRVREHVDRHLHERDLTVERLAAAHHVSVRHLYNVWARAGHEQTPAEWIASRRLERARDLLAAGGPDRPTVAEVARRCGFADVSHFGRRFRQAYGTSPGAWRRDRRA